MARIISSDNQLVFLEKSGRGALAGGWTSNELQKEQLNRMGTTRKSLAGRRINCARFSSISCKQSENRAAQWQSVQLHKQDNNWRQIMS